MAAKINFSKKVRFNTNMPAGWTWAIEKYCINEENMYVWEVELRNGGKCI